MIRSSKHILKYQTEKKTDLLNQIFYVFESDLDFYTSLILSDKLPLRPNMSSKLLPANQISHSQWKQVVYKTASECIRSQIKKASDKRYKVYKKLYQKCIKTNRHADFISKRFSELKLKTIYVSKYFIKPFYENISINIDERLFDVQSGNHFDEWIRIKTPFFQDNKHRSIKICIPVKHHKHSNKYSSWMRKDTIRLRRQGKNFFVDFIYEKAEPEKKLIGKTLGLDQGYKKLISTSDGIHLGTNLNSLYEKISKKKQGSKAFNRLLKHRDNEINRICNKLDLSNIRELVIENLKNLKHKSKLSKKTMNKMQRWLYPATRQKLERLCEENGVLLTAVNPAYTSQTCSKCGHVSRENRHGETFICLQCGHEDDADINAAVNISRMGAYNPHGPKAMIYKNL